MHFPGTIGNCFRGEPCFKAPADNAPGSGDVVLQELIDEGLKNNRELLALRREIRALEQEAPAAGAFADPKLGLGLLNMPTDTFAFDQEAMTQKQISLSQRLPWFGKLNLAERKVLLRAERQRAEVRRKELALAQGVAVAYHEMGTTLEALETNAKLREVLGVMLRVAESRYATGQGKQQDILQAQVEHNQLLDEKITLERKLRQQKDRINELLQRDRFMDIAPHPPPEMVRLQLDREQLLELADANNPSIRVRQAEVQLAQNDVELARKDFGPDFDVQVAYGQRDDDRMGNDRADFFSAGLSFTIPLWAPVKQSKNLEGSAERLEAAYLALQGVRSSLPHQIDALLAEADSLHENFDLLQQVLTLQAAQWADTSLAAYEVGNVEFSTMLTAEVRLLRYDLKLRSYHHELRSVLARLQALVGAPLPLGAEGNAGKASWRHIDPLSLNYCLPETRPEESD